MDTICQTAAPPRYYVTMSYLFGIFDYLRQSQVSITPVLDALGLTEADLADSERLLPVISLDMACELAAILTQDPLFGFHAGCHMRPSHLGIVGHLLMCCDTPEEMLQLVVRHGQLVANGVNITLDSSGEQMRLTIAMPEDRRAYSRQANEFNLTGWLALCRWLGGPDLAPDFIEFSYSCETDYSAFKAFARCDIQFNAPAVRLGFSPEFLRRALMHGDTSLRPALEAAIQERMQLRQRFAGQPDALLERIRQLIAAALMHGTPQLQAIADAAGETARRMQYMLDSRGTSFSGLVDQVRQAMAAQHLRQPDLTLIDIALMLGFSDQSTFHRAFKRWYGVGPGEYRRRTGVFQTS